MEPSPQANFKNFLIHNAISVVGFILAAFGFYITKLFNFDLVEGIFKFLQKWEDQEIDDLILFWSILFLISVIINLYVHIKRRNEQRKKKIYNSMLYATNHILRNFLLQSQLLKMEAEENSSFNQETIELFDRCTDEAEHLIKKLGAIENIDEIDIFESIKEIENN